MLRVQRRRFDVYTTSITLKLRRTDVKTTSCAYWVLRVQRRLINAHERLSKYPHKIIQTVMILT